MRQFVRSSRMQPTACECGAVNDAATPGPEMIRNRLGGQAPEPGGYSVCMRCARVKRWDEDMNLVEVDLATLSKEERHEIHQAQTLARQRHGIYKRR